MNKGYIAVLLDETGSMTGQEKRVTSGINEYIRTLQSKANCGDRPYHVVLYLFDSERWREYYNGPLNDFPLMSVKDYLPGAMTPLYDAINKTILAAEKNALDAKVLVLIDTDGMENASREVTQHQIFGQIKAKESDGWTFVFLGAELEAFGGADKAQQTMGLGIASGNTIDFKHACRDKIYHRAAEATRSYMDDKLKVSDSGFWNRA